VRTRIIVASALFVLNVHGAFAKETTAQSTAAPGSFSGDWAKKKDPFCQMTLTENGNKLTGTYSTSPNSNGKPAQKGRIEGNITKPGHAAASYTSEFANKGSKGKVELDLTGTGLKWTLVTPPTQDYGEDYSPKSVVLTKQ
jgi:hypothetical protein